MPTLLCDAASFGPSGLSLIDSLECDADLDYPGMREAVNALILAEMETMASEGVADGVEYLLRAPPIPPLRVVNNDREPPLDMARYETPMPPPANADALTWEAACSRAALAVECLEMRSVHLELASRYGVDVWRTAARDAAACAVGMQKELKRTQTAVAQVEMSRAEALRGAAPLLAGFSRRVGDAETSGVALAVALAGAVTELDRVKRLRSK